MSSDYELFLRTKMERELDQERVEEDGKKRARVREFEENYKKKIVEENKELQRNKERELKDIEKTTEEIQKKIQEKETSEKKTRDQMMLDLKKSKEEEGEKIKKEYDEIIAKNVSELSKEALEVQKELIQADSERIKMHRDFEETKIVEMQHLQEKMEKLAEAQKEKEENRQEKLYELAVKTAEQKKKNEEVVGAKIEEDAQKAIQLKSEFDQVDLNMQAHTFQTLLIRIDQISIGHLNDEISTMGTIFTNAIRHYQGCLNKLATNQLERAADHCESLSACIEKLSRHLIGMQRKLAELKKSVERDEIVKKVQEVNGKTFPLITCIARFSGRFMMNDNQGNKTDEKELGTLMEELNKLINLFGSFESQNSAMSDHVSVPVIQIKTGHNALEQKKQGQLKGPEQD